MSFFASTHVLPDYHRYVCPDYASTGMLNETNDVYSFGVLLMEIITGRSPVDYSRPPGEVVQVIHHRTTPLPRNWQIIFFIIFFPNFRRT